MKITILLAALWVGHLTHAQTQFEKRIPINPGQHVQMDFKYPEMITITTWDQSEILIEASVNINFGENNDAFDINYETTGDVSVSSTVKGYDQLPKRVLIRYQGEDYYFSTSNTQAPEVLKFKKEKGADGYEYMQYGVIMDITLNIKVPKTVTLDLDARHGLVEIVDFTQKLDVRSKYGGIDVTVPNNGSALSASTKFGEVYSNLERDFTSRDDYRIGRWVTLQTPSDVATRQSFKSEFGNVYLRKMLK